MGGRSEAAMYLGSLKGLFRGPVWDVGVLEGVGFYVGEFGCEGEIIGD